SPPAGCRLDLHGRRKEKWPLPAQDLPGPRREAEHWKAWISRLRQRERSTQEEVLPDALPFLGTLCGSDAVDGELVMATLHDLVIPGSAQYIDDIAQAEAFSGTGDGREQLLRIRRAVLQYLRWLIVCPQAVITGATRWIAIYFAEVAKERAASTG